MKKSLIKPTIIAILILIMAVACAIVIVGATETKTYTITYYSNGAVAKTDKVVAGANYTVRTEPVTKNTVASKSLYGWYDDTGKITEIKKITGIKRDYVFYEAYGKSVKNAEDFLANIKQAGNYVRLNANITIDKEITLPANGLAILDLNGYTLTIKTGATAFVGKDSSIHILNNGTSGGKIIHEGVAENSDLMNASLFTIGSNPKKNVEICVYEDANIETNVGLFDITADLTNAKFTYTFKVAGKIRASFLVRSYGIKNALFKTYPSTELDVTGQYVFEDRGNCTDTNLTFEMTDGKLNIIERAFITNEISKYNIYLTGGSFNRDFSNLYSNYVFIQDPDDNTRFVIEKCDHNDAIIGMTANCTEAGEITYKCILCGVTHTESTEALGHTSFKELVQEAITTKDKTEPGYYATTCQRCGAEEREYFYPAPRDVYVTVKYRLTTGEDRVVRVKATSLFGDNVGERLQTFTTAYIEFEYGIKQSQIYSIEIPLGVKTIAGGISDTDSVEKGLFFRNSHLEEIVLPMSIENIEATAFADIPTLKTVKGLEYITGEIGERAFQQTKGNTPYIARMTLNAKVIGTKAFEGFTMISLTFGKNVETINEGAFALLEGQTSLVKEIFIEGNNRVQLNGATLNLYNKTTERFTLSHGHQFDGIGLVYIDHNFKVTTTEPTCQEKGFDFKKCQYCGEEETDNYTDVIPCNFVEMEPVPSTCSKQGYEGTQCSMCGKIEVSKYYTFDPEVHDYTATYRYSRENICEEDYHIIGICACGKEAPPSDWKFQEAVGKHTWDEQNYIEYVKPTCGERGYKKFNCSACGYEVSEIYKATGKHTFVTDNKNTIPATCKNEGKMVWVCDVCGEVKERTAEKNPDNHEWEKDEKGNLVWTVKVPATTEKAGTQQNICTGCGKAQTKGIPVTNEETKKIDTLYIILIILGGVLILAGVGVTLYFAVFRKSVSSSYKYKFNTLNKK